MNLQPLANTCFVSGEPFVDGARVASYLVRSGTTLEIVRYDVLEPAAATFAPEGQVACRWVHAYKPRKHGENPDRALKLTAENLFVALADPTTEPTPENTRLVQFLALMLERKKILKPRGKSADGARDVYEHAKSKQRFEVTAGDLTPEFFVAVQEQLSVLVGVPKNNSPTPAPAVEPATSTDGISTAGNEGAAADIDAVAAGNIPPPPQTAEIKEATDAIADAEAGSVATTQEPRDAGGEPAVAEAVDVPQPEPVRDAESESLNSDPETASAPAEPETK